MIDEFELKGEWWIPNTDTKVNGTLSFSPESLPMLEIHGMLVGFTTTPEQVPIILGRTFSGIVTLASNFVVSRKLSTHAVSSQSFVVGYILTNKHFSTFDEILFDEVTFSVLNLNEWLDVTGFDRVMQPVSSLTFVTPPSISFKAINDCESAINYAHRWSFKSRFRNEDQQLCYVHFKYTQSRSLLGIIEDMDRFVQFVSFLTFQQVYQTEVTFQIDGKVCKCQYSNTLYDKRTQPLTGAKYLIPQDYIGSHLPDVISNWYKVYDDIEPTLRLVNRCIRYKEKIGVESFMDITRALEVFHRRTQKNSVIDREYFDQRFDALIESMDDGDKEMFGSKLTYAYEPSFPSRIRDLVNNYLEGHVAIVKRIGDVKKFARKVAVSRNYYTHFDSSLAKERLKGDDLAFAHIDTLALTLCCLCKYLGMPFEAIFVPLESVKKTYGLKKGE